MDKRDGVIEKQSVRERLRGTKASRQDNSAKKENLQEAELL